MREPLTMAVIVFVNDLTALCFTSQLLFNSTHFPRLAKSMTLKTKE